MGALSPDELACMAMDPTWKTLDPVHAFEGAVSRFIREELPADARFGPAGITLANRLYSEFRFEIWAHRIPTRWELVLADRAGHLQETIKEINEAFTQGE